MADNGHTASGRKSGLVKKPFIIGIIIVFIIGIVVAFRHSDTAEGPATTQSTPTVEPLATDTLPVQTTNTTKSSKSNTGVSVSQENYGMLIVEYQNRRLQFDQGCNMIPAEVTYKVGTKVMLDNRSSALATIHIGKVDYVLPAYGYQVIGLDTVGKLLVDCNKRQNTGTLIIQK